MSEDTTYAVCCYDTGRELEGEPSERLIEASVAEGPTGAVLAYVEQYESGRRYWQYVAPADASRMRALGHDVVTVYVEVAS